MILQSIYKLKDNEIMFNYYMDRNNKTYCIEDLFNLIDPTVIIINNLQHSFDSIIFFLLSNRSFKPFTNIKNKKNSYIFGEKFIKFYNKFENEIVITDYYSKFGQHFRSFKVANILEEYDNVNLPTAAQTTLHNYYNLLGSSSLHGKNIFNLRYPSPNPEEETFQKAAKELVSGYRKIQRGEYYNVYDYDTTNAFPAMSYDCWLPHGAGKKINPLEKIPVRYWYIKKVIVNSLNILKYDVLDLESKTHDILILYLTPETEEILNTYYKATYNILGIYIYKMRKNSFEEYFDSLLKTNENQNPYIRKYNKSLANLFIGLFGKRDKPLREYKIKQGKLLKSWKPNNNFIPPYLPIFVALNGKNKLKFISKCFPTLDNIIYAHTDGFMSLKPVNLWDENSKITGALRLQRYYNRIYIKSYGQYCGEWIDFDGRVNLTIKHSGIISCSDLSYEKFKLLDNK